MAHRFNIKHQVIIKIMSRCSKQLDSRIFPSKCLLMGGKYARLSNWGSWQNQRLYRCASGKFIVERFARVKEYLIAVDVSGQLTREHYFVIDGHMRLLGHRLIASELLKVLVLHGR